MGSRNGTNVDILGNFCELCRFMKNGSKIIAVDQLTRFETNSWLIDGDDGLGYWMKEEKIELHGAVSWNRGDAKVHDWYMYTKVADKWRCNACRLDNPLVKPTQDASMKVCQFFSDHVGFGEEQRRSKRQKIKA